MPHGLPPFSSPSMRLKWFFSSTQKPKPFVPNVYLTPDDSSLIVIPEFDHPLPVYHTPGTGSLQDHEDPRTKADSYEINRPPPVSYHHVLARNMSAHNRTAHSMPVVPPIDSLTTTCDKVNSSNGTIAGKSTSGRKLRKSQRRSVIAQATRSYETDLHWPTSVALGTSTPPTSDFEPDLPVGDNSLGPDLFYTNLSSAAVAQSTSVENLHLPSIPLVDGKASQSGSTLAKKFTRRKRPPPRQSEEPVTSIPQIDRATHDDSSPGLTPSVSPSAHHRRRSNQLPANRRITTASVAADYARFWNLSSPDLPTSGRPARTRHSTIPTLTPPFPRPPTPSYTARKPVAGPSPLRDRADARPFDNYEEDSDLSYPLRGVNDLTSDMLPRPSVLAAAVQHIDPVGFTESRWLKDDTKQSSPSLLTTSPTYSAFTLYGIHKMGGNKPAWRSTWSVQEAVSDKIPKPSLPVSMSTTAIDNLHTFSERTSSPSTSNGKLSTVRADTTQENVDNGLRRRWTVANAVTDEEIPDEVLLEQLERLRHHGDTENVNVYGGPQAQLQHARRRFSKHHAVPSPPRWLRFSDEPVWKMARSALLTCRELVRTERTYLVQIRALLGGDGTAAPIPGLVMTYAPALVHASETLLKRMLKDPSAWGIAAAFVQCGGLLESAFVSWCRIVGNFFVKNAQDHGMARVRCSSEHRRGENANLMVTGIRRRGNSMSSVPTSYSPCLPLSALLLRTKPNGREVGRLEQAEELYLRELAVLPAQRVMRYVLLYRGLLEHTPSPPSSRAMVEDAVNAALKIAQMCDGAQDNAEFLMN